MRLNIILFSCLALFSCKKSEKTEEKIVIDSPAITDSIPTTKYNLAFLSSCNLFAKTPEVGFFGERGNGELSGVAASQTNKGILYVHDDGNINTVYMTDKNGADLGKLMIDNLTTSDVEDIAVGPGPQNGKNYIYLADIGNNNLKASFATIYRFEEPVVTNVDKNTIVNITAFDKIKISYGSGKANAETIMVDPVTKDIYVLTKQNYKSYIYKVAYPQTLNEIIPLKAQAILNFDLLTGGDISADGSEILLRSTGQIWYWKRAIGESVLQTLQKLPQDAPYAINEKQGEGICFSANSDGYITDTEIKGYTGAVSNISFYKRLR
jgi:hypothetical protein